MVTYEYDKTYGDAGALHAVIAASLTGLVGVTWDTTPPPGDYNLHIMFESALLTTDKTTLDSIVVNFGT